MAKKIGALWKHKDKKTNKTYLAGNVEVIVGMPTKIVIFSNDKKEKENHPDYNIVLSEPKKENNKTNDEDL